MKIILAGMHRSGTNAVGRWLLRQSQLKNKELEPTVGDWIETCYDKHSRQGFAYVSQINHPDHHEYIYNNYINEFDNFVATIEREHIDEIKKYYDKFGEQFDYVIVIRDFKNWLASVCKMQGDFNISPLDIEKYVSHLNETRIMSFDGFGFYPMFIEYDRWCLSSEYRKRLCNVLNLRYTNCGYRNVASNGGGSSFDGMEFSGRAHEMNVTERYKEFEDNPQFSYLLTLFHDIVRVSNERFTNLTQSK